jgi:hypothetical protein
MIRRQTANVERQDTIIRCADRLLLLLFQHALTACPDDPELLLSFLFYVNAWKPKLLIPAYNTLARAASKPEAPFLLRYAAFVCAIRLEVPMEPHSLLTKRLAFTSAVASIKARSLDIVTLRADFFSSLGQLKKAQETYSQTKTVYEAAVTAAKAARRLQGISSVAQTVPLLPSAAHAFETRPARSSSLLHTSTIAETDRDVPSGLSGRSGSIGTPGATAVPLVPVSSDRHSELLASSHLLPLEQHASSAAVPLMPPPSAEHSFRSTSSHGVPTGRSSMRARASVQAQHTASVRSAQHRMVDARLQLQQQEALVLACAQRFGSAMRVLDVEFEQLLNEPTPGRLELYATFCERVHLDEGLAAYYRHTAKQLAAGIIPSEPKPSWKDARLREMLLLRTRRVNDDTIADILASIPFIRRLQRMVSLSMTFSCFFLAIGIALTGHFSLRYGQAAACLYYLDGYIQLSVAGLAMTQLAGNSSLLASTAEILYQLPTDILAGVGMSSLYTTVVYVHEHYFPYVYGLQQEESTARPFDAAGSSFWPSASEISDARTIITTDFFSGTFFLADNDQGLGRFDVLLDATVLPVQMPIVSSSLGLSSTCTVDPMSALFSFATDANFISACARHLVSAPSWSTHVVPAYQAALSPPLPLNVLFAGREALRAIDDADGSAENAIDSFSPLCFSPDVLANAYAHILSGGLVSNSGSCTPASTDAACQTLFHQLERLADSLIASDRWLFLCALFLFSGFAIFIVSLIIHVLSISPRVRRLRQTAIAALPDPADIDADILRLLSSPDLTVGLNAAGESALAALLQSLSKTQPEAQLLAAESSPADRQAGTGQMDPPENVFNTSPASGLPLLAQTPPAAFAHVATPVNASTGCDIADTKSGLPPAHLESQDLVTTVPVPVRASPVAALKGPFPQQRRSKPAPLRQSLLLRGLQRGPYDDAHHPDCSHDLDPALSPVSSGDPTSLSTAATAAALRPRCDSFSSVFTAQLSISGSSTGHGYAHTIHRGVRGTLGVMASQHAQHRAQRLRSRIRSQNRQFVLRAFVPAFLLVLPCYLAVFLYCRLFVGSLVADAVFAADLENSVMSGLSVMYRGLLATQPLFGLPFVETDPIADAFLVPERDGLVNAISEIEVVIADLEEILDQLLGHGNADVFNSAHDLGCYRDRLGLAAFCPAVEPYAEDAELAFASIYYKFTHKLAPHFLSILQAIDAAGLPLDPTPLLQLPAVPSVDPVPFYDDGAGNQSFPILPMVPDLLDTTLLWVQSLFIDLLSGTQGITNIIAPIISSAHTRVYLLALGFMGLSRAIMQFFVSTQDVKTTTDLCFSHVGAELLKDLIDALQLALQAEGQQTEEDSGSEPREESRSSLADVVAPSTLL